MKLYVHEFGFWTRRSSSFLTESRAFEHCAIYFLFKKNLQDIFNAFLEKK